MDGPVQSPCLRSEQPMASPRTLSLLPLLVLACSSAPPPPPTIDIRAPPVGSAVPAAAPTVDPDAAPVVPALAAWKPPPRSTDTAACKKIHAEQDAASTKDASIPEGGMSSGDFSPTPCLPAKGGAWGLIGSIFRWETMPPISPGTAYCGQEEYGPCLFHPVVQLVPLYVSDSGAEKRGPPIVATLVSGVLGDADLGAFDLDGDGVEELIVATEDGLILTLRDDKIKPYSKSQGLVFDRIVDFDQDGRPDLVLRNPYVGSFLSCGFRGGFPILDFGAELLVVARSLPDGSFSAADPASQAITKQQCPALPRRIVVKGEGGAVDNARLRQNIACARVWGMSGELVEKALASSCAKIPDDEDMCEHLFNARDGLPITTCPGEDVMRGWLELPPPVTLQ